MIIRRRWFLPCEISSCITSRVYDSERAAPSNTFPSSSQTSLFNTEVLPLELINFTTSLNSIHKLLLLLNQFLFFPSTSCFMLFSDLCLVSAHF